VESDDITQVTIGSFQVGIIGLKEVISELEPSSAQAADQEVERELLQRLSRKNYIPEKARGEYGQALLKEFKRQLGQTVTETEEVGLTIRVLGQGCANCQAFSQRIMEVLTELNLAADFEHVTDIKEIARYGILQSPALLINGQVMAVGQVPSKGRVKEWISKALK
jgi:small redox-active disulfide protein 2